MLFLFIIWYSVYFINCRKTFESFFPLNFLVYMFLCVCFLGKWSSSVIHSHSVVLILCRIMIKVLNLMYKCEHVSELFEFFVAVSHEQFLLKLELWFWTLVCNQVLKTFQMLADKSQFLLNFSYITGYNNPIPGSDVTVPFAQSPNHKLSSLHRPISVNPFYLVLIETTWKRKEPKYR